MAITIKRKGQAKEVISTPRHELRPLGTANKVDFGFLLDTYIQRNVGAVDGKVYTLQDMIEEFKIPKDTIYQQSKKGHWRSKMKDAINKRDADVRKKLTEHRAETIIRTQANGINQESHVRMRQSAIARMAYQKAAARLKDIDPMKLSIRDAIELLRLGLTEERRALGLPERYEIVEEDKSGDYLSTSGAKNILGRVINMARSRNGKYEETVNG